MCAPHKANIQYAVVPQQPSELIAPQFTVVGQLPVFSPCWERPILFLTMTSYLGIFSLGSYQFSRGHGDRSLSILHGCKDFRALFACVSEGQRYQRFTVLTQSLPREALRYPQTLSCSCGKTLIGSPVYPRGPLCAPGDPSYTVSGHSWILPVPPMNYYSCFGSEQITKLMGEQSEWDLRRQNPVLLFSFYSFCSCSMFLFPHLS